MRMLIAEIGSVHDGSIGNAEKLIHLAAKCGATAVKFQTHIASAETTALAPSPVYFNLEDRMSYFERTSFSIEEWRRLKQTAESVGLVFLSSPFSIDAVELLEDIGVSIYKIPSGEVTNIPMLEKIASLGKPVLLSSGMSDWRELDTAVSIFHPRCDLTLMQCSSAYPCHPRQVGLNVMLEMSERYGTAVGLSDHTLGYSAAIAAATLGASVIEKHFTFSKEMYGSDAQHSMEPQEFSFLSQAVQETWEIMDSPVDKDELSPYKEMKKIFEKSIVSSRDLSIGETLCYEHLKFKKPGTGISAADYRQIIGRKLSRPKRVDELINWEDLS